MRRSPSSSSLFLKPRQAPPSRHRRVSMGKVFGVVAVDLDESGRVVFLLHWGGQHSDALRSVLVSAANVFILICCHTSSLCNFYTKADQQQFSCFFFLNNLLPDW